MQEHEASAVNPKSYTSIPNNAGVTGRTYFEMLYIPKDTCLHLLEIDKWSGNGLKSDVCLYWALRSKSCGDHSMLTIQEGRGENALRAGTRTTDNYKHSYCRMVETTPPALHRYNTYLILPKFLSHELHGVLIFCSKNWCNDCTMFTQPRWPILPSRPNF